MFQLLDLLAMTAALVVQVNLYYMDDYPAPTMGHVAKIEMNTVPPLVFRVRGYTDEEKCVYSGLAVPYVHDYEETIPGLLGDAVIPAEPGKLTGYAVIINKKTCPGKGPELNFRVSADNWVPGRAREKGRRTTSILLASIKQDERPKWVPQVLATIENEAATNLAAQEFMEFTKNETVKSNASDTE